MRQHCCAGVFRCWRWFTSRGRAAGAWTSLVYQRNAVRCSVLFRTGRQAHGVADAIFCSA